MSTILHDLRVSVRSLAARRGFTAVAVLTLALGLGATTALFSVVHAVLLRSLPYPEPDSIVALWQTARGGAAARDRHHRVRGSGVGRDADSAGIGAARGLTAACAGRKAGALSVSEPGVLASLRAI